MPLQACPPSHDVSKNTPEFFLEQAKFYMAAGFDGIKMIEGRLQQRSVCGAFSDEKYEAVFAYAEKEQIPVLRENCSLWTNAMSHAQKYFLKNAKKPNFFSKTSCFF